MKRALELATLGKGKVSPNPMVGCVIVHNDLIIGEGWHQKYGEAHAEVNAIKTVKDESVLPECSVYVSLEPCAHYGKTPPCADLLVKKKVKKVIICNADTNPLVGGKGIKKLLDAGIQVEWGILEKEGKTLNKRFFTHLEKKRPYIILKWAETADGFIARLNYDSKWISNPLSRKLVHKWRTEEDAIMVGPSTAAYDNPQLNVRDWTGKNPTRIVIDRQLRLSQNLNLFDHSQHTICYNLHKNEQSPNLEFVKLPEENFLHFLMEDLGKKSIQSVIVEGGAILLKELLSEGLWDEARVFKTQVTFKTGFEAPAIRGTLIQSEKLLDDQLLVYHPFEYESSK
jgi:diaminohydroxyphosphoribosylaminopyrimidine deaminase / 5-amino-6-(5-phosphoribosylamino)uracil reductase